MQAHNSINTLKLVPAIVVSGASLTRGMVILAAGFKFFSSYGINNTIGLGISFLFACKIGVDTFSQGYSDAQKTTEEIAEVCNQISNRISEKMKEWTIPSAIKQSVTERTWGAIALCQQKHLPPEISAHILSYVISGFESPIQMSELGKKSENSVLAAMSIMAKKKEINKETDTFAAVINNKR